VSETCKFCLRDAELQRSHIVSEFFYRYDEKHRVLNVDMSDHYPVFDQKGRREKLLCVDCEQYFNEHFEKPMKRMWIDERKLPQVLEGDGVVISGLEYVPFKLFHLSVLWRASVSSVAATVSLGPHETRIRQMLLACSAGAVTEYPIVARALYLPKTREVADGVVALPQRGRQGGQTVYCAVFGGCAWYYVVASHKLDVAIQEWALNENGRMLAAVDSLRDVHEIGAIFRNYERNAMKFAWRDPWQPRSRRGSGNRGV